ncbi:unnamed protein product [Amoebophrya sp. A120]|nr:unnamed protein product [Amoebophrya sp. A120]|eukprot:GSA120T00024747001.1
MARIFLGGIGFVDEESFPGLSKESTEVHEMFEHAWVFQDFSEKALPGRIEEYIGKGWVKADELTYTVAQVSDFSQYDLYSPRRAEIVYTTQMELGAARDRAIQGRRLQLLHKHCSLERELAATEVALVGRAETADSHSLVEELRTPLREKTNEVLVNLHDITEDHPLRIELDSPRKRPNKTYPTERRQDVTEEDSILWQHLLEEREKRQYYCLLEDPSEHCDFAIEQQLRINDKRRLYLIRQDLLKTREVREREATGAYDRIFCNSPANRPRDGPVVRVDHTTRSFARDGKDMFELEYQMRLQLEWAMEIGFPPLAFTGLEKPAKQGKCATTASSSCPDSSAYNPASWVITSGRGRAPTPASTASTGAAGTVTSAASRRKQARTSSHGEAAAPSATIGTAAAPVPTTAHRGAAASSSSSSSSSSASSSAAGAPPATAAPAPGHAEIDAARFPISAAFAKELEKEHLFEDREQDLQLSTNNKRPGRAGDHDVASIAPADVAVADSGIKNRSLLGSTATLWSDADDAAGKDDATGAGASGKEPPNAVVAAEVEENAATSLEPGKKRTRTAAGCAEEPGVHRVDHVNGAGSSSSSSSRNRNEGHLESMSKSPIGFQFLCTFSGQGSGDDSRDGPLAIARQAAGVFLPEKQGDPAKEAAKEAMRAFLPPASPLAGSPTEEYRGKLPQFHFKSFWGDDVDEATKCGNFEQLAKEGKIILRRGTRIANPLTNRVPSTACSPPASVFPVRPALPTITDPRNKRPATGLPALFGSASSSSSTNAALRPNVQWNVGTMIACADEKKQRGHSVGAAGADGQAKEPGTKRTRIEARPGNKTSGSAGSSSSSSRIHHDGTRHATSTRPLGFQFQFTVAAQDKGVFKSRSSGTLAAARQAATIFASRKNDDPIRAAAKEATKAFLRTAPAGTSTEEEGGREADV